MKKTNSFIAFFILISVMMMVGFYLFSDPYYRVLTANTDEAEGLDYLNLYRKTLNEKAFTQLLKKLVNEKNDDISMRTVSYYCCQNRICEMIPDLNHKIQFVASFPKDSVWVEQLNPFCYRESSSESFLCESTLKSCSMLTAACGGK